MCIVKRHTYLRGADKQPNTNKVFSGYQGRSIVVIARTNQTTTTTKNERERELELENFILQGL